LEKCKVAHAQNSFIGNNGFENRFLVLLEPLLDVLENIQVVGGSQPFYDSKIMPE
jgi:hypothetical protein